MFTEDLSIFLADFGVRVACGNVLSLGLFDTPDEVVSGVAISAEYQVIVEADKFESVAVRAATIFVDGDAYKVLNFFRLGDGKFARIELEEAAA